MTVPVGLTNTFVLLQKSDRNPKSEFFLPRPQYNPTMQMATCFSIKLTHKQSHSTGCTCSSIVKVYHDNITDNSDTNLHDELDKIELPAVDDIPYVWYQSKDVVKGFKYTR